MHLLKNPITTAQTGHEYCLVVYLDIEVAFDSVWHKGLLFKLHDIEVGEQMLSWLYITTIFKIGLFKYRLEFLNHCANQ
jgi:hypothetical protein